MHEPETKQQFIELRAAGHTFEAISCQLNVAKSTLIGWSKEFDHEISNLKAIELEALQQKYYVAKQGRISIFGEQLEAIKKELSTRDLKDVPTATLYSIFTKIALALKEEETSVSFKERNSFINERDLATTNEWQA